MQVADGSLASFESFMQRFCPGRTLGGLMLTTPHLVCTPPPLAIALQSQHTLTDDLQCLRGGFILETLVQNATAGGNPK